MNAGMRARHVAVIGLGYVGLPVAAAFGRVGQSGYRVRHERTPDQRTVTRDSTAQARLPAQISSPRRSASRATAQDLRLARISISSPSRRRSTPANSPTSSRCGAPRHASARRSRRATSSSTNSTVYPGVTEDVCVPVLEKASGLKWKTDFNVGYSPERINPGDKERRFDNILKIVSGDTPETLDIVDAVYKSVVTAGTHRASSIRVAEFAKVLENTQRDINIALINEVALISDRLGIDTRDVLEAAGTKWNFLPFKPGLVGGHCIGVDPFYIAHKAEEVGYHPHVIHSGRRVNDSMGVYVANRVARSIMRRAGNGRPVVTVLGVTFKENVPDIRNTRVVDIVRELEDFGITVQLHDPEADGDLLQEEYQLDADAPREAAAGRRRRAGRGARQLPQGRLGSRSSRC